jgi:hypothetical protein
MRRQLKKPSLASILVAGALFAVAVTVEAQQPGIFPQIGVLSLSHHSKMRTYTQPFCWVSVNLDIEKAKM